MAFYVLLVSGSIALLQKESTSCGESKKCLPANDMRRACKPKKGSARGRQKKTPYRFFCFITDVMKRGKKQKINTYPNPGWYIKNKWKMQNKKQKNPQSQTTKSNAKGEMKNGANFSAKKVDARKNMIAHQPTHRISSPPLRVADSPAWGWAFFQVTRRSC